MDDRWLSAAGAFALFWVALLLLQISRQLNDTNRMLKHLADMVWNERKR